jgi:hypothetical protein
VEEWAFSSTFVGHFRGTQNICRAHPAMGGEVMDAAEIIAKLDKPCAAWGCIDARISCSWREEMIAAIEQVCRERDDYLRMIQTDLNVQIERANEALIAAGFEDWETIAEGINQLAKERGAAQADVKRLAIAGQFFMDHAPAYYQTETALDEKHFILGSQHREAIDAAMKDSSSVG